MRALVIYGTRYGNTAKVAEAIGDGLKTVAGVDVMSIDQALPAHVVAADLVVVGGPTEAHGVTPPLKEFLRGMRGAFEGKHVAAFDTRLAAARLLTGSAAAGIAGALRKAGANVLEPEESFLVRGKEPQLEAGEVARALAWGRELALRMPAAATAAVGAR